MDEGANSGNSRRATEDTAAYKRRRRDSEENAGGTSDDWHSDKKRKRFEPSANVGRLYEEKHRTPTGECEPATGESSGCAGVSETDNDETDADPGDDRKSRERMVELTRVPLTRLGAPIHMLHPTEQYHILLRDNEDLVSEIIRLYKELLTLTHIFVSHEEGCSIKTYCRARAMYYSIAFSHSLVTMNGIHLPDGDPTRYISERSRTLELIAEAGMLQGEDAIDRLECCGKNYRVLEDPEFPLEDALSLLQDYGIWP